jgi:hypothetical protein
MGFKKLTYDEAKEKMAESAERRKQRPKSAAAKAGAQRSKARKVHKASLLAAFNHRCRVRDNYRCQWPKCRYRDLKIPVHHINERSQRPDLRYNSDNGACICPAHHDYLHHTVEGRRQAKELGLLGGKTYEHNQKERQTDGSD